MTKLKDFWILIMPLGFLFVLPSLILIYEKSIMIDKLPIPNNINIVGLFLIFIGLFIDFLCISIFFIKGQGTPSPKQITPKLVTKKLVTINLYKYVRNPMILGYFVILFGITIFFKSEMMLLYSMLVVVIMHLFVVFVEEKDLEERFGKAYLEYKNKVSRWIPKFK